MRSLSIAILSTIIFFSCEEPVTLDLKQTPSHVVIEGLVTNKPGYQSVKVTRSVDFYNSGKTPRITDAVVTVKDDVGKTVNFIHNPRNHVDSAGIYVPAMPFVGEIGRTYTLNVKVGTEQFEGKDQLLSVIPVDSLTYRINEDEAEDPELEGKIYEVLVYAREPQDEKNFYLFKFYRNDSLVFDSDTDIYYSDDELLQEKIDGVTGPGFYGINDKARIEIYSITRAGYVFYNDLQSLLVNDAGGMFGPIPSSPRTNLTNGALGFFQVSALNTKEVIIE